MLRLNFVVFVLLSFANQAFLDSLIFDYSFITLILLKPNDLRDSRLFRLTLFFILILLFEVAVDLLVITWNGPFVSCRQVLPWLARQPSWLRQLYLLLAQLLSFLFNFRISKLFPFSRVFLKLFSLLGSLGHLLGNGVWNTRNCWQVLHLRHFKLTSSHLVLVCSLLFG